MDGIDLSDLKNAAQARLADEKQRAASHRPADSAATPYVAKERPADGSAGVPQGVDAPLPSIMDVTHENLADIMEYSRYVPVVLDLWADWCQPCKQLGPVLEKLAKEYGGKFLLAPLNTEEEPELASAFQVKSIPTVIALAAGKPIDMFSGAVPEPQLRAWIEALLKAVDGKLEELPIQIRKHIQRLAGGNEEPPAPAPTVVDEAEELAQQGDYAAAQKLLREHLVNNPKDHLAESALNMYEVLEKSENASEDTIIKADENPDDVAAQCDAADLEMTTVGAEAAYTRLLNTVARTTGDDKNAAREHLVKLLKVADSSDPLVIAARTKLASLLY
ncbi:MAG: tetratricopeptide repeat protein [Lawsonella sp.]|nr:tetratricopeptide repeat protein [Mycobacteriales bacterium]